MMGTSEGPRISYAQNGEDVRLWRVFDDLDDGFYVEIGGYHPEHDSISRSFYERGWSGIVVEPVPENAGRFKAERPRDRVVEALCGAREGVGRIHVVSGTGLSTVVAEHAASHERRGFPSREVDVPCRTAASILSDSPPREIHFMMVDVEGAERDVLEGMDFATFRPWVVIVEATVPSTQIPSHADWDHLLTTQGYEFVTFDGLNRFYVAQEHQEVSATLVNPPNVYDNYITNYQAHLQADCERLGEQRDAEYALRLELVVREELLLSRLGAQADKLRRAEEAGYEAERLRRELNDACEARDRFARERDALARVLQGVETSRSWRLTSPLRRLSSGG